MFLTSDSPGRLETFAASVAHEVRTPLSSLRLCIEGLARTEGLSAQNRRRVELALGQIDYLEDLTDQMRSLYTPRGPSLDPADVNEVAREMAREMAETHREVRVRLICEAGLPRVEAGRGPVRGVLGNLCRNGLRAMEGRGTLRIWTRRRSFEAVEVAVQDTGCGIPASEISRVWEPFFTTGPEGMGLGLAMVKAVAEAHGGGVCVESEVGRGTTVTVWFRAYPQEVGHATGAGG